MGTDVATAPSSDRAGAKTAPEASDGARPQPELFDLVDVAMVVDTVSGDLPENLAAGPGKAVPPDMVSIDILRESLVPEISANFSFAATPAPAPAPNPAPAPAAAHIERSLTPVTPEQIARDPGAVEWTKDWSFSADRSEGAAKDDEDRWDADRAALRAELEQGADGPLPALFSPGDAPTPLRLPDMPEGFLDSRINRAAITIDGVRDGASEVLMYDLTGTRIVANLEARPPAGAMVLHLMGEETGYAYARVLATLTYLNRDQAATGGERLITIDATTNKGALFALGSVSLMVDAPLDPFDAALDRRLQEGYSPAVTADDLHSADDGEDDADPVGAAAAFAPVSADGSVLLYGDDEWAMPWSPALDNDFGFALFEPKPLSYYLDEADFAAPAAAPPEPVHIEITDVPVPVPADHAVDPAVFEYDGNRYMVFVDQPPAAPPATVMLDTGNAPSDVWIAQNPQHSAARPGEPGSLVVADLFESDLGGKGGGPAATAPAEPATPSYSSWLVGTPPATDDLTKPPTDDAAGA